MPTRQCRSCQEPFEAERPRMYCSYACRDLAITARPWAGSESIRKDPSRNFQQDSNGNWWYVRPNGGGRTRCRRKECERCGDSYPVYSGYFKQSRFCSMSCRTRARPLRGRNPLKRSGYVVLYRPDHPAADGGGYVREHRLVMEAKLGRPLAASEQVHHINAVRDDNRPENLELWAGSHPNGVRASDNVKHCPTCTCGEQ